MQLRHDIPGVGEQVFGIHHPNGAVKKLSLPHGSFATVTASGEMAIRVPKPSTCRAGAPAQVCSIKRSDLRGPVQRQSVWKALYAKSQLLYFPTATFLKQIAPAPPPPITRDVVLVVDRSGSMSEGDGTGRHKIDAAKDAVSLFVQLVRAGTGNRAGLVSFSTTAGPPSFAIANVTDPNKNALIGGPPFAGGLVGALTPGGATSIGEGLDAARAQFPMPGANPRAILLLTDGLQNTPRFIADVEAALVGIDVHSIGLGSESNLDGALLSALSKSHGGLYTRASSGLALLKFFSQAFGNIFEAGVLLDPEFDLPANQSAPPLPFQVCGEERLTVVVGWDRIDTSLVVQLRTPAEASSQLGWRVREFLGRNWTYLRVPLPQGAERDGVWKVEVLRPGGGEFPPPTPALRYFVNVIPSGGPKLLREPDAQYVYTGDDISPLIRVRHADGSWPEDVEIELTVQRPDAGVGNLVSEAGLATETPVDGDLIPARQTTLKAIEQSTGQPAVRYTEQTFVLKDDAANTRGSFEGAGSAGIALRDFLRVDGNYTFHARAKYGLCRGTRELVWTTHVDVGIDPGRTDVTTDPLGTGPDGSECQRMTFTPRDKYGNRLGPGRVGDLAISARPGSNITGPVRDLRNGAYQIDFCWDPASTTPPGIVVGQPGRDPVPVGPADRRLFVYSVTFVCGVNKDDCCACAPVRPGQYATDINIHNFTDRDSAVIKRIIPLVLSGAVRAQPQVAAITAVDRLVLPAHTATMDDCCRLQELLFGAAVEGSVPLTTGVREIISTVELAVTAVYTKDGGAIDVQVIPPRQL